MCPQTKDTFVKLVLQDQMQSLKKGNIRRFLSFSDSLMWNDKHHGTLLQTQTIKLKVGLYGLYVLQNRKTSELPKLITI